MVAIASCSWLVGIRQEIFQKKTPSAEFALNMTQTKRTSCGRPILYYARKAYYYYSSAVYFFVAGVSAQMLQKSQQTNTKYEAGYTAKRYIYFSMQCARHMRAT